MYRYLCEGIVKSCGKIVYDSRAMAKADCDRQAGYRKPYLCPRCGYWHVTSTRRPKGPWYRRKK